MPTWVEEDRPVIPDGFLWSHGYYWRFGRRYLVEYCSREIMVYEMVGVNGGVLWCERFSHPCPTLEELRRIQHMASKWITAAVVKRGRAKSLACSTDKTLFEDRPALKDFMVELEGEEGKARETSVLMICITDNGVRVGLKDEDAGGWLWREEVTLIKALNAIEKALQSGDVKWSVPGGKWKKGGK